MDLFTDSVSCLGKFLYFNKKGINWVESATSWKFENHNINNLITFNWLLYSKIDS